MHKIVIGVLVALLVSNIYVEIALLGRLPYYWHLLWLLPTAASVVSFLISLLTHRTWGRYLAKKLLLSVEMPKIPFAICSALGLTFSALTSYAPPIGYVSGFLLALAQSMAALYGMLLGWRRLKVVDMSLRFENLPAEFEGYHIVLLSDLHLGSFRESSKFMKQVVCHVNAQRPDAIVFAGDLVNSSVEEAKPFIPLLSTLRATDGVFAVLGNHDYPSRGNTGHIQSEGLRLAEMERQMGWLVLINESHSVMRGKSQLVFAGMDDLASRRQSDFENLKATLDRASGDQFVILLSHRPNIWRKGVLKEKKVSLTLSGHTHAGQLQLFNWSPAVVDCTEWRGLYQQESQALYVSQGTGTKFLFRLGTYAEITLITLLNNKPENVPFKA